jgi:hypothetical protein
MTATVVTGIFTLLGSAIGGLIGYLVAIKVSDRKEFQKAAIDFFEAFLPAIMTLDERYHLENINDSSVREILERTFSQQIKAMLRFRLYLPINKIECFDKAWCDYCRYDVNGEPKSPYLAKYEEKILERRPTKEVALERINNLLKFIDTIHPFLLKLNSG